MRSFVAGVAASLVASAIVYFVLAATEALPLLLRLGAMALVLVLGVVVAWLASRGARQHEGEGISVGRRIKAKGGITVKDVDVERPDGNVRVGDDLKSGDEVAIKDVRIGRRRDRK
jgi:membrane protein implicated in regulation of membrane protease activity